MAMNISMNKGITYYSRKDWVKVDVHTFISPLVDQVSKELYIKKIPAKSLLVLAIFNLALVRSAEIFELAFEIFSNQEGFQAKYLTKMEAPAWKGFRDLSGTLSMKIVSVPKADFIKLIDVWAKPINENYNIGIVQCRDVIKLALGIFLVDSQDELNQSLLTLIKNIDRIEVEPNGHFLFPSMKLVFQ